MKIQCSCGAKHQIGDTPPPPGQRFSIICPSCGLDLSEFVAQLYRQAGATAAPPSPQPAAPEGLLLSDEPGAPTSAPPALQARLHKRQTAPAAPEPAETPIDENGVPCVKHPGFIAGEKCRVCSKPICPKCMELFGYVCSPLCKAKADSHGINVPVYEGQKSVMEARFWRKMSLLGSAAGGVIVLLLGFWFWYAWFGSVPKPYFSVRFANPSYSGQALFAGPENSQIIFLHGGALARHDVKSKKQIWSREVIDPQKIQEEAAKQIAAIEKMNAKLRLEGDNDLFKVPSRERLISRLTRSAAEELTLYIRGQNIWVASPGKVTQYTWDTGAVVKELPVNRGYGGLISRGDELLVVDTSSGKPRVTYIDLVKAETRTEDLGGQAATALASADAAGNPDVFLAGLKGSATTGLPLTPGKDMDKPIDPAKAAEQARRMSLPERIALPAVLSSSMTQERALAEMRETARKRAGGDDEFPTSVSLIPTRNGFVQFTAKLLESRLVEREAMKAAPAKSVLEGPVTVANTMEAANEILNEMQRNRGGNTVTENLSRYQVTIEQPGTPNAWSGEVIGPPKVYPLQTVNILAANKMIHVLDKSNRKLWQAPLTFDVVGGVDALEEDLAVYGQGPCVESNGSLYVFDRGVLTAFDLKSGKVHWRLPSVGVMGIFFDNLGHIYVNTTSAGPDSIKYSRQIDLSQRVGDLVLKVNEADGKVLWSVEPGGLVNYVSGKFVYTLQSYMPYEPDLDDEVIDDGPSTPPYMRIRRINPRNGSEMWEHFQQRAPLDVQFDKNSIRLVFKKEVQVLKFLSF